MNSGPSKTINNNSRDVLFCGKYYCWLSGISTSPGNWNGYWHLQVAHIASGQGRALRVDDRRAVILLCPLAHECHVSDSERYSEKTINSVSYPTIDERHTLWIKQRMDPEYYDPQWLSHFWIGSVPEPERPPEKWLAMLARNTGIIL